jgi:hypothetical protein
MRRLFLTLAATGLVAAGPALGGNIRIGLSLNAGALSLKAPTAAAVSGHAVQVPLTLADARGTGAGWTLKLEVPSAVTITDITARCAPGSTCTLPKPIAGGGILHAATNTGMGVMQILVTVAPLRSGGSVPLAFSVS